MPEFKNLNKYIGLTPEEQEQLKLAQEKSKLGEEITSPMGKVRTGLQSALGKVDYDAIIHPQEHSPEEREEALLGMGSGMMGIGSLKGVKKVPLNKLQENFISDIDSFLEPKKSAIQQVIKNSTPEIKEIAPITAEQSKKILLDLFKNHKNRPYTYDEVGEAFNTLGDEAAGELFKSNPVEGYMDLDQFLDYIAYKNQ